MKVAIIGGGLGGLLAGAALSKNHEVHVYEQLDMYGGRFTNIEYKGFQLTTGALHMIPHGPTGPLARLMKAGGRGREDRQDRARRLLHEEGQHADLILSF